MHRRRQKGKGGRGPLLDFHTWYRKCLCNKHSFFENIPTLTTIVNWGAIIAEWVPGQWAQISFRTRISWNFQKSWHFSGNTCLSKRKVFLFTRDLWRRHPLICGLGHVPNTPLICHSLRRKKVLVLLFVLGNFIAPLLLKNALQLHYDVNVVNKLYIIVHSTYVQSQAYRDFYFEQLYSRSTCTCALCSYDSLVLCTFVAVSEYRNDSRCLTIYGLPKNVRKNGIS